jgi:phosphoglucosamine mutase
MTGSSHEPSFQPPRFGTDGLRGHAGEPPLDPETLRRVGAAFGIWLQRVGPDRKRVLIGNDGRESSTWILDALAQGLGSTDCTVADLGLVTTPALAWLTRNEPFVAGIMISASHNPATDNGIKLFDQDGRKLPDEAERELEMLTGRIEFADLTTPRPRDASASISHYVEHLGNAFGELQLDGCTVVVDAANGGASEIAPSVLRALGADVVPVCCEPDGFNINQDCGSLHPESLAEVVRQSGAVLGICLDGDGDRSIFVDDRGAVHDGDAVLATLAPHLKARGRLPHDTVVATVMTNLGLRRHLARSGIRVEMTPVGDRHVARRMREGGFALGAEQSGHVLFDLDGHLCGDGLFTALTILGLPGVREKGASQAFATFTRYPQRLANVRVRAKPPLESILPLAAAAARIEAELGEDGRVLLRYSGTEPLCRVMVEAPDAATVDRHVDELVQIVDAEIGAG